MGCVAVFRVVFFVCTLRKTNKAPENGQLVFQPSISSAMLVSRGVCLFCKGIPDDILGKFHFGGNDTLVWENSSK